MRRLLAAVRRTITAAAHAGQYVARATRSHTLGLTDALRWAARTGRAIVIDYRKEDGTESTRTIEPREVTDTKAGDEIVKTFDRLRDAHRTFRIDRITGYAAA